MDLSLTPVDELMQIRRSLTELRAREAALEAMFLANDAHGPFGGFTAEARVVRCLHDVLDITKLPSEIVEDPKYYATRRTTRVILEPLDFDDQPMRLVRDTDQRQLRHTA